MASVVEVMARFSADTSSFRRNVDASAESMRKMRSQADDMAKQTEKSMGGMQAKAVALGTIVGNLAANGIARLGQGVFELGKAVLSQASNMQQAEMAFNSFLGSAEKSKAFLDDLAKFAAKTPFEFPELVDASKQMMAFGFQASQILPMMTAIGDAAAGLGTGAEGIERITRQLGQMKMKGVAAGEELRVIAEAGVPAWQYLADTMGVTVPEAMKMVEKRLVSADDAIAAITEGLEKGTKNARGFGGMMEQQSKTLQGVISTFKDSVMNSLVKAAKPLVEILTQIVAAATPVAESFAVGIGGALETITPMMISLFKSLAGVADIFKAIPGPVYGVVAALVAWHLIMKAAAPVVATVGKASSTTVTAITSLGTAWRYAGQMARDSAGQQAGAMARIKAMSTVMGTAGKATSLLKSAGAGLMGMLGGPWGIALAAGTVGIMKFMEAQQQAAQYVDDLTNSLDAQTGAATEASFKVITDMLSTKFSLDEWKQIPFTMGQIASAAVQGGKAYEDLQAKVDAWVNTVGTTNGANAELTQTALALQVVIGRQGGVMDEARQAAELKRMADEGGKEAVAAYAAATSDAVDPQVALKDATKATTEAAKQLEGAWKELQGILDVSAARDNWKSSLRDMGAEFKKLAKDEKGDAQGMSLAFHDMIRDKVSGLQTYAQSFKDPKVQMEKFSEGIKTMKAKAIKNGMKKADADAFFGKFSTWANNAGTDAADAVVDGFAKMKEAKRLAEVAAAAALLAQTAKVAMMAKLDAHSPSKVFIKIGGYIGAGLVKGMENSTNKVAKTATKMAQAAIDAFKQKAKDALALANSVAESMRSAGSITNAQAGEDGPLGVDQVIQTMRDNVAATKRFLANVKALKAAGLNKQAVADIINAGVEQGGATAAALLSGGAGAVREANSLQSQLNSTAAALGSLAAQNMYGMTTSQARAGQNINIAKGGISITFPQGTSARDRKQIEEWVDKAVEAAVRKVMKEGKRK